MRKSSFLAGILLPIILVGWMNAYPKPLDILRLKNFGNPLLRVTVAYKPRITAAKAAFIGTSRSIPFSTSYFTKYGLFPSINMSVGSATIAETRYHFEHAENINPLATTLIELNYAYFTNTMIASFSKNRLLLEHTKYDPLYYFLYKTSPVRDVYFALFSFESTKRSIDRLFGWIEGPWRKIESLKQKPSVPPQRFTDETPFEHFNAILNIAEKNGTNAVLFIPPASAVQEEMLYGDKWEELEQWKRALTETVAKHNAKTGSGITLWDFSGFNSITTKYVGQANEWYSDKDHYRVKVLDMIFKKAYGACSDDCGIPTDFGVRLTKENIDEHLHSLRQKKEEYQRLRPAMN